MADDGCSRPVDAGLFQAGGTCPFCQEPIALGERIVKCERCGALHHDTCWRHGEGCSSYHCDDRDRSDEEITAPDLVITAAETENVVVPPKPRRATPMEATRPFLPPKPKRVSFLALFALAFGLLCGGGLIGAWNGDVRFLAGGIGIGAVSIILGVIALVVINTGHKVYGFAPAAAGVLLSCLLIVVYFVRLEGFDRARQQSVTVDLMTTNNRPTDAKLAKLPPALARALRANVVIQCEQSGLMGRGTALGSGIIMKIAERRAMIITNKHVVGSGADPDIKVLLVNGESSAGRVEWRAPGEIDVVVLSCQVLTLAAFAPTSIASGEATQGERVFAVGNPMNLCWSYTEGVISGIRTQHQDGRELSIYQTQTPINCGNSGGGLYDMAGGLIGVNTWVKDKSVAEGLNFAIAAKSIRELMSDEERKRFLE